MWLFAMFDLPVDSAEARKSYTRFRKALIKEGFSMLQYSVYARYCSSEELATAHRSQIRMVVPARGQVRFLNVTDHQFGKMEIHYEKSVLPPENKPSQMLLF
ncbi:MAG: CRISPR-associated endonuclease Cas2 [Acidimicrobiales bacterium]|nr:CRISPR-associated endonuclease Cas2 [Acidimicrobiales bacterium]